ncbi:Acyl transferase/acyl hydrolase/lysophospholipase [Penicillium nucicola]|uniref:Acyl transferase/acyl hydrolase/lysophospholipase n=1 Tax=Penicillium nucicola TaxID=1850975 RepID=UPI002545B55F|nr:Acyl transferase/acyl hydrolase/lysophospholipase [Penicillium nucicola]KAJ5761957.1 Acyl transferase/acyl hydrolase/lysophospholipase [Penicillium nucicola]
MVSLTADVNGSNAHASTDGTSLEDSCANLNGNTSSPNETHVSKVALLEPIAICGMSVRLPGGLHSPQQLWDFLVAKGDAHGPVPKSRYNASAYFSEEVIPSRTKTEYGYFLDESIDLASVDTSFLTMGKSEVERMDPSQRQMLEVARECMEDAGEMNWEGRPIGCFMGTFGKDWAEMFSIDSQQYGPNRASGTGDFMLPNRISYEMDLTGPSMTVRTACSSSLVALHEACMSLSRGDCEGAIVGGANLMLCPGLTTALADEMVLAPDGSCKTFSSDANGYARGEAVSAVFIKPLAEAIRHGSPVRAVIRATASNCDGRGSGSGIKAPNDIAQEALIRHTYELAGITDYSKTAFVECHGTGTPIGDPLETAAVGRVFGPFGGVQIGSVKPNVGHSEGASGLTSLIKSVMALENRIIPPNIKLNKPNPNILWDEYGLSVPTEPTPWPEDRSARISINSFGIGGANAHVILDSAESFGISSVPNQLTVSPQLLVYSANNVESLKKTIATYQTYVQTNPGRVSDLAFTLGNRRHHLPCRAFAVANTVGNITAATPSKSGEEPSIVMVFTGQGAQWPQMGALMIDSPSYPVFKESIRSLDTHLQTLTDAPEWNIEEELMKGPETSRLGSAELSQPLCTAIQIALVDTFASIGVEPTAVVGHSSGEVAAAYAAGAITAEEAIAVAFYRGRITKLQTKPGAMAAIGMGSHEVQEYLQPGVIVACENSHQSITLAGDSEAVRLAVDKIKEARPDVPARHLKVDKAYHSHHMVEIGDDYHALIEHQVSVKNPTKLFFSSVKGKLLTEDSSLGPEYWRKNLESPVLFHSAISSIIQHDIAKNMVFLEVGPHSTLAGPLRQIQAQHSTSSPYVSTLIRNQNDEESFLTAIGKMHVLNAALDLSKVISKGSILPDLPRYPWDHSRKFWYESRLSKEWRHPEHKHHNLLGMRVADSLEFDVRFRNVFHMDNASWIRDHKVGDDIVFPFAGYAAMIGEAVRQTTGVNEGFKLRNIIISTALVLNGSDTVEIMTTLRRHRLTDSLDSEWWEFAIASHSGTVWTKHCFGEARSYSEDLGYAENNMPLVRKVRTRRCYQSLATSGLNFGPAFQRLEDVRSGTISQNATSEVVAKSTDGKDYHLHPTVIDALLQLINIAASKGFAEAATKMMVPTSVEELSIYRCYEDVQVRAAASYSPNGSVVGGGQCVTPDGKIVLRSSGIRLSVIDDHDTRNSGDAAARAEWGPHIDFLDINTLIKPSIGHNNEKPLMTELAHLCMIHTKRVIAGLETSISHMYKYRSWIDRRLQSVDLQSLHDLDNAAIEQRVAQIVSGLSQSPAFPIAVAIQKISRHAQEIFTGDIEALDLLISDDLLAKVYIAMDHSDVSLFFKHLTHSKPNLRILEIGAGTGGSTARILKLLTPDNKTLYSNYTFTDISSGFFAGAEERLSKYPSMEYATLDISKDVSEQGFEGRTYDLILATNVIHATKSLNESLTHVRQLLAPNGWLLLCELTPVFKSINYIFGILAGWWEGEHDDRRDEPYVDAERWKRELKAAGFRSPDAVVLDSTEPNHLNVLIAARPAIENIPERRVTLLNIPESKNVSAMHQGLENRGYAVHKCGLNDLPLPAGQDVIALLDDEGPFFDNIDEQRFSSFKTLVENLQNCGILWVTSLSQIQCQDPRFGQVHGIARTIRSEMLVDFATCEVDNVGTSLDQIMDVFERFQVRQEDESFKPEFEYAVVENTVHVGRIHSFSMQDELLTSDSTDSIALCTRKPGRLTALHWAHREIEAPKDDEVEVEIYATGLNFKDVLCAMGIVEASNNGFGLEAAGVVSRAGLGVKGLKAGDRVMLMPRYAFGTRVIISENLCERIPSGLSFEDAATMPCVFATAMYSIFDIGNLKKGQSILIHSACGGVGLATIQLAQMVGAEIYATVGNEEKVQYLMDTYGLPRNRIFNSRNTSFVSDVMRETNGEGVDLALNSLSGELLHATWKCITIFGTMVEIGKRDLIGFAKLDMNPFLSNRNYCSVDLDQVCLKRPTIAKKLLIDIVELLRERHIHPIRPIKVFKAPDILEAFRYMQQGVHLGKIVVSIRDAAGQENLGDLVQQRKKPTHLDSAASYLLVGGLGGLGRSVSTWMAERGARHLIFLSRSAGSSLLHQEFSQELASMGCRADYVQGSVSSLDDVTKAVACAQGRLKGILQMSMVLADQSFIRMTLNEWNTAVDPKVKGTWNLHNASVSANADLDFFVLFSSISGLIGNSGQTNYAGANTFLDAFSQYRLSLGLPACAIQIGSVDEVGYTAENESLMQMAKSRGVLNETVSESTLLEAIERAMKSASSELSPIASDTINNFCLGIRSSTSLNDPGNRSLWKKDIRMAALHNGGEAGSTSTSASNDDLNVFLRTARSDHAFLCRSSSAPFLAVEIGKKVFSLMLKPEEELLTSCSLSDIGMDSLVAIEVRQWWKTIFGFDISAMEMMGMGTLDALGDHAVKGMLKLFHGDEEKAS